MTKKIAISVPDDVAERLAAEPNVSAFVTAAVRQRMVSEQVRAMQLAAGVEFTDEDRRKAREVWAATEAAITPELVAEAWDRFGPVIHARNGDSSRG
jgi:hypothetical protein